MSFFLVPHQVTDTTAKIWIGAIDEKVSSSDVRLEYSGNDTSNTVELDANKWEEWKTWNGSQDKMAYPSRAWKLAELSKRPPKKVTLNYQRVDIKPLTPRTTYSLKLHVGGHTAVVSDKHLRQGRVTTLPEKLPAKGEQPFTILLGSCFYGPKDDTGMVGATYHRIYKEQPPDIKILCGDQVYLDNPWAKTTSPLWFWSYVRPGSFKAMLLEKYVSNWGQMVGDDAGFRQLLKDGANYFCSDDHEFWNNAPDFGGVGLAYTLTRKARDWWFETARELFGAFQSDAPFETFEIGGEGDPPLSVCIADTRINRESYYCQRFMRDKDLEAVGQWIASLEEKKGPGVLVLSQPVLVGENNQENNIRSLRDTGLLGGIKSFLQRRLPTSITDLSRNIKGSLDRSLPDYTRQYKQLMKYITESPRSIVVLTGDVHFGRVAYLGPEPGSGNSKLVEVISSPMQVVSNFWGRPELGDYKPAPSLNSGQITSRNPFATPESENNTENHFATIEFSSAGDTTVSMKVKYWPILSSGDQNLSPAQECEFSLS